MCGSLTAPQLRRSRVGVFRRGQGRGRRRGEGGREVVAQQICRVFRERKIKKGGWEKNRGRKEGALWRNVSNATLSHNQAHV